MYFAGLCGAAWPVLALAIRAKTSGIAWWYSDAYNWHSDTLVETVECHGIQLVHKALSQGRLDLFTRVCHKLNEKQAFKQENAALAGQ